MRISLKGIDLIKHFEGLRLNAYQDVIGIWTIGFGHTGADVYEGLTIDEPKATDLLHVDLRKFEDGINSMVKVELTQNQFDALISFVYNVGLGNFQKSTMLKAINLMNFIKAATQFPMWANAAGKKIPMLVKRRNEERQLFES
jgi:lysozyme